MQKSRIISLFLILYPSLMMANDYVLTSEKKIKDIEIKLYSKKETVPQALVENRAKMDICFAGDCSLSREGYRAGHLGVAYPFSRAVVSDIAEFKDKKFIFVDSSYFHGSTEIVTQIYLLENKTLELVFEGVSLSVSPAGKEFKTEFKLVNESELKSTSKHKGDKTFKYDNVLKRFK
jgi:hypothetical protein